MGEPLRYTCVFGEAGTATELDRVYASKQLFTVGRAVVEVELPLGLMHNVT